MMREHSAEPAGVPAAHLVNIPIDDPIAYRGQPVMTTELMARCFGATAKQISDNFSNNAARFAEGVHFHKVQGEALRELKNQPDIIGLVGKTAAHLLLWTERGVARHAKILDTDAAWEIFEQLEDTYFAVRGRSAVMLPDFTNPIIAARVWADEREARELAERTKAEIGSRREATAMNTAMLANRRANELQKQLDGLADWATVKRMEKHYHREFPWRPLKKMSEQIGAPVNQVTDVNYGVVNAYHADVWMSVYGVAIPKAGAEGSA